jgi:hypothetical protein
MMKKTELKKILKPLIKECVKEAIFEDGILAGLISEVATGLSGTPRPASIAPKAPKEDRIVERMKRNAFSREQSTKLKEHKNKLMAAIGGDAYNGVDLFKDTTPAAAQGSPAQQAAPMAGVGAQDPGVDISNLFGSVGKHWNAHMTEMKERE